MSKKILFLSHKFYPDIGGIEVNSEILAIGFQQAGMEVKLVTWTNEKGSKSFPFDVIRNPDLKALFKLHRWADIVYENNPCLRLAWPRIFTRKPYVVAIRTWINRMDGKLGFQDVLKNKWLQNASAVIAVSDAVRKKSWPKAIVIGNPYRNSLFRIKPEIERDRDFVFLGRLVSDKGADFAIQAVATLSKLAEYKSLSSPGLTLTIIGEGTQKEALKDMVKNLGLEKNVVFSGMLTGEDLVECLNRHRYLLVPSIWEEPFGNVALEGMGCGCIPIVSDGGGLPDAVGKAGLIFKRKDLNDLIEVIKAVYHNQFLVQQLLAAAPEHLRNHQPEFIAKRYLEVVEQSVSKN